MKKSEHHSPKIEFPGWPKAFEAEGRATVAGAKTLYAACSFRTDSPVREEWRTANHGSHMAHNLSEGFRAWNAVHRRDLCLTAVPQPNDLTFRSVSRLDVILWILFIAGFFLLLN